MEINLRNEPKLLSQVEYMKADARRCFRCKIWMEARGIGTGKREKLNHDASHKQSLQCGYLKCILSIRPVSHMVHK